MKKNDSKRISLSRTSIRPLATTNLEEVAAGALPWTKHSICADQCCETDRLQNCPRTF